MDVGCGQHPVPLPSSLGPLRTPYEPGIKLQYLSDDTLVIEPV